MVSLDYRLKPIYTTKECSSCGALYNKSCGCSKGGFVDKFVRDPNKTPDSSQRPPHNCPKCGNPVDEPFVFNQDPGENSSQSPPHIDHHCCYGCGDSLDGIFCQQCTCECCGNGAHIGYNCPPKVPIISNPEPCYNQNIDEFLQTLPSFHPTCYSGDENSFTYDSNLNFVDDSPNPPPQPRTDSYEFCEDDAHYGHNFPPQKIPIYYDDDDDEESSTPLRHIIIFELPTCIAITPVLSTKEPEESLIMGDEHLNTIPKKELDEFIKSSVENLVPNPSESDELSNIESECNVPVGDDFTTFSNSLFDADEIFFSSDDESFSDEIDSLLEEFSSELAHINLIPSGINEADFDPEEEICLIEKLFDSLMKEIDIFLAPDDSMPLGIENDDYDSEGDILFLEEFLSNDSPSLPKNESFHFDVSSSSRPPTKPPDDDGFYFDDEPDTGGDISKQYDLMPRILPTQPTLCLVIDTLLPFSSENKDKVHLLSHRGFKAFQLISDSPMMIYGGNIPTLEDCPDFKDSCLWFYPSIMVTDTINKGQNPSKTGQIRAQNRKRGKVNSQKSTKSQTRQNRSQGNQKVKGKQSEELNLGSPPMARKRTPAFYLTWEDLVSKSINEFFPPSRTKNLRNEISNFQQRFDESFHEAWDRYKDLLRAFPHHGSTELHQLNTFYNALNPADQDSLNSAAGGNVLERRTQDVLTIIENKSKVRNSCNKSVVSQVKSCDANPNSSSEITKLTHAVNQQTSACLTTGGNTFPELRDNIQGYVSAAAVNYNQGNSVYRPPGMANQIRPPGSGSLPSNTVANPKGELKAITTQSGIVLDGPSVPTPSSFINLEEEESVDETLTDQDLAEYTIKVPPPHVQKYKPSSQRDFVVHQRDPLHPNIPYPSRMLKQKQQEKDEVQIHKFWQMFKQLHINITLAGALILMPKYQKMLKALLSNKEKLQELVNTPLNENCSAVILKKLPEKVRDRGKFLIPCGFRLPEFISTRMTLELANRAIFTPAKIARDVFVPIGKFTFPADFIIVDYESDPRVLLILGRPFLQTARALIGVHGEEMILRDELTSPEVKDDIFDPEGGNVLPDKLLDLDSTKNLHPPLHVNPLSGSTTYSSSPNQLLEEFADELALITFPPEYDNDLQFDIESDLKEIEYLFYHDPIKDIDSSIKDSIDQSNLADLNDNLVDSILEMFTDEHALDYSSPPIFDEYNDDLFELESNTKNVYDDPFDSKGEKIKESKLLIDELDLLCDFLFPSEYDSFLSEDFSRVDALPSTNNEDKVFNPSFLIQENLFKIIALVVQDKKLAISNASLMLEDYDPPLYELLFFKEVPRSKMLLSFSSENEEKNYKPGIHTSGKVHSYLITKLSHQGYKVFKINQVLKSLMKIFLFSYGKDTHILVVPCLHFYPLDQF
nr:hypothetical protein [Tanacetum cinerariifolium]